MSVRAEQRKRRVENVAKGLLDLSPMQLDQPVVIPGRTLHDRVNPESAGQFTSDEAAMNYFRQDLDAVITYLEDACDVRLAKVTRKTWKKHSFRVTNPKYDPAVDDKAFAHGLVDCTLVKLRRVPIDALGNKRKPSEVDEDGNHFPDYKIGYFTFPDGVAAKDDKPIVVDRKHHEVEILRKIRPNHKDSVAGLVVYHPDTKVLLGLFAENLVRRHTYLETSNKNFNKKLAGAKLAGLIPEGQGEIMADRLRLLEGNG